MSCLEPRRDLLLPGRGPGHARCFTSGLPGEGGRAAVAGAADRPVSRCDLAARTGMPPPRLAGLVNLLEAAGAVRPGRGAEPTDDPPAQAQPAITAADLARHHRSVERSRVEMRRYAEMTDCRHRHPRQVSSLRLYPARATNDLAVT